MNTRQAKTTNPLARSILHSAIGLGLFAVVTAGLIALTHTLTTGRITDQIRRAQASALLEIIPVDQHDNDLLNDTFILPDPARLGLNAPTSGFRARLQGKVTGIIVPVTAPDGYSGAIRLLVGLSAKGDILGVRSVEHHETPGLGDKIELKKSDWMLAFNGKSLTSPEGDRWKLRKDGGEFDQFTGATITPRAVVKAISQALAWFNDHQAEALAMTPASPLPELTQQTSVNTPGASVHE